MKKLSLILLIISLVIVGCSTTTTTLSEKDYEEIMTTKGKEMSTSLSVISNSLKSWTTNDSWDEDIKLAISNYKSTASDIRQISPPEQYSKAHELILKSLDEYDLFMAEMLNVISNINNGEADKAIESIKKADEYMTNGGRYTEQSTNEIRKIKKELGN